MRLKTVGQRVLVKPDPLEEKRGAIVIVRPQDLERAERAATGSGIVVQLGSLAFKDIGQGEPWCDIGDYITFARHAGKIIKDPDNEKEEYFMIRDEDVQAVILPKEVA